MAAKMVLIAITIRIPRVVFASAEQLSRQEAIGIPPGRSLHAGWRAQL
jgi:hypothetical protein